MKKKQPIYAAVKKHQTHIIVTVVIKDNVGT